MIVKHGLLNVYRTKWMISDSQGKKHFTPEDAASVLSLFPLMWSFFQLENGCWMCLMSFSTQSISVTPNILNPKLSALTPGLTEGRELQVQNVVILSHNILMVTWKKNSCLQRGKKNRAGDENWRGIRCMACSCDVYFVVVALRKGSSIQCLSLLSLCSSCCTLFTSDPRFLVWLRLHNGDPSHEPPPWWQPPGDRKKSGF